MDVKVHRRDTKGGPVWLGPPAPNAVYRQRTPARMTGGASHHSLTIGIGAGAPRTVALEDGAEIEYLAERAAAAGALTVFDTGLPTIVPVAALLGLGDAGAELLCALMAGINAAGGVAVLDLDDDYWSLPVDALAASAFRPAGGSSAWRSSLAAMARAARQRLETALAAVSGVIVSTDVLAAVVRTHTSAPVWVLPNALDPGDFPPSGCAADGRIRIGFGGGWQHGIDLPLVLPGLAAVAQRPNVSVHMWRCHPEMFNARGREPGEFVYEGMPYRHEGGTLSPARYYSASGQLDIAVAPLQDIPSNHARSVTKWMEHAIHGSAVVVSDVPPFRALPDGTCLKARTAGEFTSALTALVEDAELRQRIGAAARAHVLERYSVEALGPQWQAWVADVRRAPLEAANRRYEAADKRYREALAGLKAALAARFR